jgi:lipopolysaccharide transport protein LptA
VKVQRRSGLRAVALLALGLGACGADTSPPPRGDVAVAPFSAERSGGAALPDVATSLAVKLGGLGVGGVVAPRRVGDWPSNASTAERVALRDRIGARTLVSGSATRSKNGITLQARVLDLDSGVALGDPLVERAENDADLLRALDALADGVARRILDPPPPKLASNKPRKSKSDDPTRKPIEIQADTLDAQTVTGGRQLTFTGHVSATQGDIALRCDSLQAFYPTGASEPDQLIAKGSIHVTQRDRTAICTDAVFYRQDEKLVCTGSPAELTEECSRAEAEKFTFYLDSEKVEMLRPKVQGRECAEGQAPETAASPAPVQAAPETPPSPPAQSGTQP